MNDFLIDTLTEREIQSKINNYETGINNLNQFYKISSSFIKSKGGNFLCFLATQLHINKGSEHSFYVIFIPPNSNKAIRLRLSDHPANNDEWNIHSQKGKPNVIYSIYVGKLNNNLICTDWNKTLCNGVPVYEKGFSNKIFWKEEYLQNFFMTMKKVYNSCSLHESMDCLIHRILMESLEEILH